MTDQTEEVKKETGVPCKYGEQSCYKPGGCLDFSIEIKRQMKDYYQDEATAEIVVRANRLMMSPYCIYRHPDWVEQYKINFNAPIQKCSCGKDAYWWDGEKSICGKCLERQEDYRRGYAYNNQATRIISLEVKYGSTP